MKKSLEWLKPYTEVIKLRNPTKEEARKQKKLFSIK